MKHMAPGKSPGNMHIQNYSDGKWLYDFEAGEFLGAPRALIRTASRNPEFQRAIDKGFQRLNVAR